MCVRCIVCVPSYVRKCVRRTQCYTTRGEICAFVIVLCVCVCVCVCVMEYIYIYIGIIMHLKKKFDKRNCYEKKK